MHEEDTLKKQADFLGIAYQEYLAADNRQRTAMKARHFRKVKSDARANGLDPEEEADRIRQDFPEFPRTPPRIISDEEVAAEQIIGERGQILVRTNSAKLEEIARGVVRKLRPTTPAVVAKDEEYEEEEDDDEEHEEEEDEDEEDEDPEEEDEFPPTFVKQGNLKVYVHGAEVPPAETDPEKRDGVTVGEIEEIYKPPGVADLVGDRPPRTLTDLYARWPLSDDPSYFIRVERTKPKRYAGLDVAGFIGEVRGRVVNETDLHRWLGGTEYLLTVYGPDPRGKRDINDLPIIKPLTEPIKLVVPVLPPNMTAIPAMQQDNGTPASNVQQFGMNPFGQMPTPATNQHDASIYKTNTDFTLNMMKVTKAEAEQREKEDRMNNAVVMNMFTESQKLQAEQAKEEARRQERLMDKQLESEKEARRAAEAARLAAEQKMEKFLEQARERTGNSNLDADALMKIVATVSPNREAESERQANHYRMQAETMKVAHEDALKMLHDRHREDLRRSDERMKDQETFYKRIVEEERVKGSDREKDLRNELEKVRREEREMSQARLQEAKERHATELALQEKGYERELRAARESWDSKLSVADRIHQVTELSLKEQLAKAEQEAERALEEAKEAGDPIKVIERARAQAEGLGYEKKDDAPKTAFERFAATAGAGLSQALSTIDQWGPQMMANRAAGAAPVQARAPQQFAAPPRRMAGPQGQPGQVRQNPQQGQPQRRRVPRAAAWATETVGPMTRPVVPETPLGFQPDKPEQAAPQAVPQQPVQEQIQEQPGTQMAVVAENQAQAPMFPEKFSQHFSDEGMIGFLMQAEQSINGAIDPTVFADQFALRFPQEAQTIAKHFEAEEVLDVVRNMEGSEASPLVRRDGARWMASMWSALRVKMSA